MNKLLTALFCVLAIAGSLACWWFIPRVTLAAMALLMIVAFGRRG